MSMACGRPQGGRWVRLMWTRGGGTKTRFSTYAGVLPLSFFIFSYECLECVNQYEIVSPSQDIDADFNQ